jgi:predicted dehydrogenase
MTGRKSLPAPISRRQFVGGAIASAAATPWLSVRVAGQEAKRKIKLGVVGNGGRGGWIAKLFQKHGGYEMHAVADYFQAVADKCGDALGVDKARRFPGLSGYKKLIDSGVEAIAIEDIPYFYPEQAAAAVAAGLHIYMAKPVAVDVPGTMAIGNLARECTRKQRVFLVDYQMPTDPHHVEILKRIREGGLGKLAQVNTTGISGGFPDPALTATIESRMQGLIWVNDIALGCDNVGNYDIHAIDTAVWVIGQRPVAAMGASAITRPDPHGDSRDVCSVVFEYADGLVHNHFGQALGNNNDGILDCRVHGPKANAALSYWGKAFIRGGDKHYVGKVENLYEAGAVRNIEAFHRNVTEGRFENETALRSVDSTLAVILAREAAARHGRLAMDDLIKENRKLTVNLDGLKA